MQNLLDIQTTYSASDVTTYENSVAGASETVTASQLYNYVANVPTTSDVNPATNANFTPGQVDIYKAAIPVSGSTDFATVETFFSGLAQTEIDLVGTGTFNTTYGSEAQIGAGGSWDWSSITEYLGAVYGTGEAATHPL